LLHVLHALHVLHGAAILQLVLAVQQELQLEVEPFTLRAPQRNAEVLLDALPLLLHEVIVNNVALLETDVLLVQNVLDQRLLHDQREDIFTFAHNLHDLVQVDRYRMQVDLALELVHEAVGDVKLGKVLYLLHI